MVKQNPMNKYFQEILEISKISSLWDIIKINDFVFSTVPFTDSCFDFKNESAEELYRGFKSLEIGGWCGLNAKFLSSLLDLYNIKNRYYNYGVIGTNVTHVGIVIEYDHMEFFFDPYYNRYYAHKDGFPLTFDALMRLVQNRDFDRIVPVYGDGKKPVKKDTLIYMTGKELFDYIKYQDYEKTMMTTFGEINYLLLLLIKIKDVAWSSKL